MDGLMQDWPLLVSNILRHAETYHGFREVVSLLPEGGSHRYTYRDLGVRARQLAEALTRLGISPGDRVGTLAWNTHRHVEIWFGASGMGAVTHTINPRLFAEQLVYIINHAEDRVLMVDVTFVPLVEAIADKLKTVEHIIVMAPAAAMPESSLNLMSYEDLLAAEPGTFHWPRFDENTACNLCYTSGTTGNPKGVLYSHRSTFLHTLITLSADTLDVRASGCILPVVPMFHANAWGIPYAALASGAKLVMGGPHHEPEALHKLMMEEEVTVTAAVPTIWLGMLKYLKETGKGCGKLEGVTIGGSAAPRSMIEAFQKEYGVRVNHAWGMTETSPLGSVGSDNGATIAMGAAERLDMQTKQGRPVLGVEMAIKDPETGAHLPHDGETSGHLMVRGPWISSSYYAHEGGDILDAEGWFDTGDVACLDQYGFMQITDRAKDVIKSGGEWISSIELENEALAHPAVAEAAVIGLPHPKWDERPLLVVRLEPGESLFADQMREHLSGRVAKWWLPDDMAIVEEIPHTATGKISKKDLRDQFRDYVLPTI
ncbi:long-chain fatty acid--CoA ligase [Yunchengibacter salinarum]|uniref:long-chain fatty acid--CoA ligase n=1 Tax=Yunchengibacter salinarum TaxID=3133399 RepID=UPI0035B5A4CD